MSFQFFLYSSKPASLLLQGASFTSVKMLIEAIEAFIANWNQRATPFEWTKEEVHQQQMKYSYSNLC